MENQRARQEEQAQKEKEHNSAHYPQLLLVTLFCSYHPNSIRVQRSNEFQCTFQFWILILKIRWMNFAFGGHDFSSSLNAVIPHQRISDAKGRTGAVERRAAPPKGTAGGQELGPIFGGFLAFFGGPIVEHLGFWKCKQYEYIVAKLKQPNHSQTPSGLCVLCNVWPRCPNEGGGSQTPGGVRAAEG